MSVEIIKGNLLDMAEAGDYNYIMHGCNCFHAMGSGIAGQIARRYPCVPDVDRGTVYGGPGKLGDWTEALVSNVQRMLPAPQSGWEDRPKYDTIELSDPFTILNCYTQYKPGPDFIPSIFPYLIRKLNEEFKGQIIGLPAIGCGIAGSMDNLGTVLIPILLEEGPDIDWEIVLL